MTLDAPAILMVAPNGARKARTDHPEIPMTPAELARTAARCAEAGASMIHLHVRDGDGGHSLDPARYADAIAAIKAEVGDALIVQITTESVGIYQPAEQMDAVRRVKPEAASLAIREFLPDPAREPAFREFLAWMHGEGVMPQYILYSADDVRWLHDLRRRGIVQGESPFMLFVLGRHPKGRRPAPADLLPFVAANDDEGGRDWPWAVCAFGRREAACALTALTLGGHSRVGFENNLHLPDGAMASDNSELVLAVRGGLDAIGRSVASASDARRILAAAGAWA